MKIKETKVNFGTGNYLCENIRCVLYECDDCRGSGYFEMFLYELIDYLKQYYLDWDFKGFRQFVKKNSKYIGEGLYKVKCQNCDGKGYWEEWY